MTRSWMKILSNKRDRGVLISEELIDTPGIAEFVGNRVLNDLNRLKTPISLEADGNPNLITGSTIEVTSDICAGKYLVESIQTTMGSEAGYKLSLNAAAYYGDLAFEEPVLDIYAVFTPIQIISIGDPKYMVEFDASSSYSNVAPIVNYRWTMPDASIQNGTDSTVWWVFDEVDITNGNDELIILEVADALGNTASISGIITLDTLTQNIPIKYRHMYGALTTVGVGSVDGGNVWNTLDIPAISVAASNFAISGGYSASGHALFGTSDGKIYKTIDNCLTSTVVYNTSSPVNDVNIPELDAMYAVAGCEDGKVYRSITHGDTWSQIGNFAFPILQVKHDYTNFDHIIILGSGLNNMYETYNAGSNWIRITTGVNGLWLADSNSKNYLAHTTGIKNLTDNIEVASGISLAFPALTYGIDIDDSLMPGAGIMTVANNGQHYIYSGSLVETQYNTDNKTKHMVRDGEVPVLVYYAVASGIGKSLDHNITMSGLYYPSGTMPEGGWGRKVAYGPLSSPIPPARLVWRGKQNIGVTVEGFCYADIGASGGWNYITGSKGFGESDTYNEETISTTPGYIVFGRHELNYIEVPNNDVPIAHQNYAQLVESNATNGTPDIVGLYFSRKIPSSGQLPEVYALVAGAQFAIPDLQKWSDFFTSPTTVDVFESPQGGEDGHTAYTLYRNYAIPRNKNQLLISVLPAIFSTSNRFYKYNCDTGGLSNQFEADGTYSRQYLNVRFTTDYWALVRTYNGGSTFTANVMENSTYVAANSMGSTASEIVYDSAIDPATIYFCIPETIGSSTIGVYKATMYGIGSKQLILPAPLGTNKIAAFSVTHDVAESKDYLAVVFDDPSQNIGVVRYSTDGGLSWNSGPTIIYGSASFTNGIWYMAPRD